MESSFIPVILFIIVGAVLVIFLLDYVVDLSVVEDNDDAICTRLKTISEDDCNQIIDDVRMNQMLVGLTFASIIIGCSFLVFRLMH